MSIPEVIGRYQIKEELGRGGMATVYLAHDPHFDREVAIKVLPKEFLHDPSFFERFSKEARTIARLEHQRILPVYDFGEAEGIPYIVMRYMHQKSLHEKLKAASGPGLPIEETLRYIGQVAEALDFAHQHNVIHRDLKPGNILLDDQDNTYLSDFGIAKVIEASMTFSGTLWVGTPSYMAPEQVQGGKPGPATDIYALGAMLFELLTGRVPFVAEDPLALAYLHVNEPVPQLAEIRPDIQDRFQVVVEKAMAKNPGDRYSAASQLADDLADRVEGKIPGEITPEPGTAVDSAQPAPSETVQAAAPSSSDEKSAPAQDQPVYQTRVPEPAPLMDQKEPVSEEKELAAPKQPTTPKTKAARKPRKVRKAKPKRERKKVEINIPWKWAGPALGGFLLILFLILVYFGVIPLSGLQQMMALYIPSPSAAAVLDSETCYSSFEYDLYVQSPWSDNPVRIDGRPSSEFEWADAKCNYTTLYIPEYSGDELIPTNPIRVKFWMKNDAKWIYVLLRVNKTYGTPGGMFFDHWWSNWNKSDGGGVSLEGEADDIHGWNEIQWFSDTDDGGKNNVVGSAYEDDSNYWFELKKEMNSGDDLDWSWKPGGTTGMNTSTLIGIWGLTNNRGGHQVSLDIHFADR